MCGINGIASFKPVLDKALLLLQRDTLCHRGPDDSGEWWSSDSRVGLGHCRLAIIDLSPTGHQPLEDLKKELVIVFNGEIYNYKELKNVLQTKGHFFYSSSDTEVILEAYREWGNDCLEHFNGTFAFALFDTRNQQLFMARDRAGEKPLFYNFRDGVLRFASELKALMADRSLPRIIDYPAMDCYLTLGYVPGERCILKGFNKLPPAHALCFNLNTREFKVWQYWQLSDFATENTEEKSDPELLDTLESLLEDAVRRQLVADVPVGILLSGGIDSSLVTAMAARAQGKVRTFTVRFPNHDVYDETDHARLIARHFNTDHTELDASEINVNLLPILARQFDEPIVDSSMVPTFLLSQLIKKHCCVALGGDGGDELFGGYSTYNRIELIQQWHGVIPAFLRKYIPHIAAKIMPSGYRGREFLLSLDIDFKHELPMFGPHFDSWSRKKLMNNKPDWTFEAENIRTLRIKEHADVLQRITRMDFENYLAEDVLVKVDRASMLNSLEVRAPFLDHRLIEFAFGKVPSKLKVSSMDRKILLRRLCDRVLPKEFDQNRKQGFSIPLGKWLQNGPWHDFFQTILFDSDQKLFDKKHISKMIRRQEAGHSNSESLFALVLFELWRKEYNVQY